MRYFVKPSAFSSTFAVALSGALWSTLKGVAGLGSAARETPVDRARVIMNFMRFRN
jgi:hypothetical protein